MPVSNPTNLTTGSSNNVTSSTTASVSNTANSLLLLTVVQRTGITADPNQPTITGLSLTWELVRTKVYDPTSSSRRRISVFRAMGASASGTIGIDYGGQSQTHASWILNEYANADTGGTNGSAAIVQSADANDVVGTTSLTVTLGAFGSADNATFGAFAGEGTATTTAGTGFGSKVQVSNGGSIDVSTEFRNDNDTSVDMSWSASQNPCGGIAIEIKAATSTSVKDIIGGSGIIPFAR